MYLSTDANFQQVSGVTPQTCELPLLSRDYEYETCQKPEMSLLAELGQAPLSQDTSSCASDDSDDVGIIENCTIGNERDSEAAKEEERNCSSMENLDSVTEITGFATLGHEGEAYEEAKLEENCSSVENLEFLTEVTGSVTASNEGVAFDETKQDEKNCSFVVNLDGLTEVTGSDAIGNEVKASEEAKQEEENCSFMECSTEITVSAAAICNEGGSSEETKHSEENCSTLANLECSKEVTVSAATGNAASSEKAEQDEGNCSSMENLECLTEITVSAATSNGEGAYKEPKQDVKGRSCTEDFVSCAEVTDFAANNLPIASVVESSQDISTMSNGNNEILHSSQENSAQFSDAVGDKRTCDEVHMTDDMKLDTSEEQAAKKRRLMPLDDESDSKSNL